ncbi:MAG: DUF1648 domain-containing protein [Saprospiraceae bacterium]|nr:DUF1648 domain-containing protein [Saprospiraceae bacterium]
MENRWLYLLLGVVVVIWVGSLVALYPRIPDTIPVHFNAAGIPDDWGPKRTVWIIPAMGTALAFLLLWLPARASGLMNYPIRLTEENRQKQQWLAVRFLRVTAGLILLLFIYISWTMVRVTWTADGQTPLGPVPWIFLGAILLNMAVYFWFSWRNR